MDFVLSFEHFSRVTNFPNLMCNTIVSSGTALRVDQTTWTTNMAALVNSMNAAYTNHTALIADFQLKACMPLSNFSPDATLKQWLFSQPSTTPPSTVTNFQTGGPFCHNVASKFTSLNINPIISDTTSETPGYQTLKNDVRTVFYAMFSMLYGEFVSYCTVAGSACTGKVPLNISNANLTAAATALAQFIENNVYSYLLNATTQEYYTIDQFLNSVYIALTTQTTVSTSVAGWNTFMNNLMFIAMQPYFCFLYVVSQMPPKEASSTVHALRNNNLRGQAVLTIYKFIAYVLYGTYMLVSQYDPSSSDALLIRQAIDINVIGLFNAEYNSFSAQLEQVPNTIQQTVDNINGLDDTNQQVIMARSNALNIVSNETRVHAANSKANKIKWMWISFLIVYIVAAVVVIALTQFLPPGAALDITLQAFLGTSVALFLVLCILGML